MAGTGSMRPEGWASERAILRNEAIWLTGMKTIIYWSDADQAYLAEVPGAITATTLSSRLDTAILLYSVTVQLTVGGDDNRNNL